MATVPNMLTKDAPVLEALTVQVFETPLPSSVQSSLDIF